MPLPIEVKARRRAQMAPDRPPARGRKCCQDATGEVPFHDVGNVSCGEAEGVNPRNGSESRAPAALSGRTHGVLWSPRSTGAFTLALHRSQQCNVPD
jgi:hypothetical protein